MPGDILEAAIQTHATCWTFCLTVVLKIIARWFGLKYGDTFLRRSSHFSASFAIVSTMCVQDKADILRSSTSSASYITVIEGWPVFAAWAPLGLAFELSVQFCDCSRSSLSEQATVARSCISLIVLKTEEPVRMTSCISLIVLKTEEPVRMTSCISLIVLKTEEPVTMTSCISLIVVKTEEPVTMTSFLAYHL